MSGKYQHIYKLVAKLFIILILAGLIYQYISKMLILSEKKELKNSISKKIVSGSINEISKVSKSIRKNISYSFSYKGKEYHRKIQDAFSYSCTLNYKNTKFPIVIDSLQPETNFILFLKRDFNYFGYPIPDSMNRVFQCVNPAGNYYLSPAPICPD